MDYYPNKLLYKPYIICQSTDLPLSPTHRDILSDVSMNFIREIVQIIRFTYNHHDDLRNDQPDILYPLQ